MTPRRLQQRRRILKARAVAERLAAADHAAAALARAEAASLAVRLAREVGLSAAGTGRTDGALLAARAALADRLHVAMLQVAQRESALSAGEALAASRATAARLARHSAETLVERAADAVAATIERRALLAPRRMPDRFA